MFPFRRLAISLLLLLVMSPAARAQVSVTFRLEGGRLLVDGREDSRFVVADPAGGHGRFSFSGPAGATVEVGGVRYRLAGPGRLALDTRLDAAPDAVFLPFRRTLLPSSAAAFIAHDAVSAFAAQQETALEDQALRMVAEIRDLTPGAERAALVTQLGLHLAQMFTVKQILRAREIEALEQDVKALRQDWQQRQLRREAIIEQRLVYLIGR